MKVTRQPRNHWKSNPRSKFTENGTHTVKNLCIAHLVLSGLLCFHGTSLAQNEALSIDTLTVESAIDIALSHQPLLQAADAGVAASEAGKRLALSTYWPQISFSASGTHTEGTFVFNPSIPARNQIYSTYTTGLTANQMIYDFGKTASRVGATTDLVTASKQDYRLTRDAVATNAEVAFYAAMQAGELKTVNEETVKQTEDHLRSARAFYSVGTRPLLDVTRAEVDVANANVGLIQARNAQRVALLQLENAMGVHLKAGYVLKGHVNISPVTFLLDSARTVAMSNRPDILSARAHYEALSSFASAAWGLHLPTLSATGTYNWSGFDVNLYGRWTAGLTFSLPIFQGFGINAQVDQADAAAQAQLAQVRSIIENAMLDVEQNYLSVQEAAERIAATSKLVEQADESLRLAEKQYAAGVGTAIEVTDAQVVRANARITAIQAIYDHTIALTRLKQSMGTMNAEKNNGQ